MRLFLLLFICAGLFSFDPVAQQHQTVDDGDRIIDFWKTYTGRIQIINTPDHDLIMYLMDKSEDGIGYFVYIQSHQSVMEDQTKSWATLSVHPEEKYYKMTVDGNSIQFGVDGNIYGLSDFTIPLDRIESSFTAAGNLYEAPALQDVVSCQCVHRSTDDSNCQSGGEGSLGCTQKNTSASAAQLYCRVLACSDARYSCCTPAAEK